MLKRTLVVVSVAIGCSSAAPGGPGPVDASTDKTVVINEIFASGSSAADPDWVELKNVTGGAVDLGGYKIRDNLVVDLYTLPAATSIDPGAYLIIYCDDQADGGVAGGVHVPWKLSSTKGDEVHLLDRSGVELDSTIFGIDVPSDKSWGRLPDGTGAFVRTTPTQGQPNI